MTEGVKPNLIVDSKGTEVFVKPPKEEQVSGDPDKQGSSLSKEGFAVVGAAAGAAAADSLGEVAEKFADVIVEKIRGVRERPEKAGELSKKSFKYIQERIMKDDTPGPERKVLMEKRRRMYEDMEKAGLFDETVRLIINIVRENDWNNVVDEVQALAYRQEGEMRGRAGFRKEWEGLVRAAINGAALGISYEGYQGIANDVEALRRNGMTPQGLKRLKRRVEREHFMPLGFKPHDYVGDVLRRRREEQQQAYGQQFRDYSGQVNQILKDLVEGRIKPGDALDLTDKSSDEMKDALVKLAEGLGVVDTFVERQRWVDMEYLQEFYTRFDPRSEPKFFKDETDQEKRRLWEDRWELARAAFYKKATASFPDKLKESQDLALLTREQTERLYAMDGVKVMLEGYVSAIYNKDDDFWLITDFAGFEKFRLRLRGKVLLDDEDFFKGENKRERELRAKEADSVAWNLIWASNLVESLDSRYSISSGRHGDLPSQVVSDEYRNMMHPQEKFEDKCGSGHYWGEYGNWGVTQVGRIMEEHNVSKRELAYKVAKSPSEYWTSKKEGGGVVVYVPECYPVVTARSYFEEVTSGGGDNQKPILDHLIARERIPWETVLSDSWAIYIFGKFNKGVQFVEFFTPSGDPKVLEEGKERPWVNRFKEISKKRLGLPKKLARLRKEGKTHQTFHNLKVWGVFASRGGVQSPAERKVTTPFSYNDERVMESRLRSPQLRLLGGNILRPERLRIE